MSEDLFHTFVSFFWLDNSSYLSSVDPIVWCHHTEWGLPAALVLQECLHQLLPNNRSECTLYQANAPESLLHALFTCEKNSVAAEALLYLTRPYDRSITAERSLLFKLDICDPIYELPTVLVLYTGLNLIWRNRTSGKGTAAYQVRAELECLISLLRRSRRRRLREAGDIISNTMANF